MLAIRAMISSDIEAVLKLEAETLEVSHWKRAEYEQVLLHHNDVYYRRAAWVAVDGQELVGFAVACLLVDACQLESIVVAKSARRNGIGRALLDSVTSWSLASGAQKVQLEVRSGNGSAIAFYESAGLLREGLRRRYYRDPDDDAVLMGKPLYSDD